MDRKYVIGIDFGTLSGRAVLTAVDDGSELVSAVMDYPHGVIEGCLPDGKTVLEPEWNLQLADDYIDVLCRIVP